MPKIVKVNSEIGRTAISETVRMKLWAVSGGRCELCNRLLYSDQYFGTDGNFGQMAHIHAVSVGGPRHKYGMTPEEKNDISNLMLLCADHHHMIDTYPDDFSDGLLIIRKKQHEERIRSVTEISYEQSCRIVTFFSNIDNAEIFSSENLLRAAVISSGLYASQNPIIQLHQDSRTRYIPSKEEFVSKAAELELQYKQWFDGIVKSQDTVALFALAPQPLLFKLGTLINDQHNVKVFQCHREGHKWAWKNTNETVTYKFTKTVELKESANVALVMDLSAEIKDSRIVSAIGDAIVYHITIPTPNRSFVQTEAIQDQFVPIFRQAMETIKNENPLCKSIKVFMAMPQSLAIRAGMDYMPKADLPLILFEQSNADEGFFEAITIGG